MIDIQTENRKKPRSKASESFDRYNMHPPKGKLLRFIPRSSKRMIENSWPDTDGRGGQTQNKELLKEHQPDKRMQGAKYHPQMWFPGLYFLNLQGKGGNECSDHFCIGIHAAG